MKLTKSDITQIFRSNYPEPKETFISDTDIIVWLWQGLSEFYSRVDCEWTISEATIPLYANTRFYAYPPDLIGLREVFVKDGEDWKRLTPISREQLIENPMNESTDDTPFYYYEYATGLEIYPVPTEESKEESVSAGVFTSYDPTDNYFYDSTANWSLNAYTGQHCEVTASGVTQLFTITQNTENRIYVDETPQDTIVNASSWSYSIWDYEHRLKIVYKQRPPLPNDTANDLQSSLTEATNAEQFQYFIPDQYFPTILSYLLYKGCIKDGLLNDAAFHKKEFENGILIANEQGKKNRDLMFSLRSPNPFEDARTTARRVAPADSIIIRR